MLKKFALASSLTLLAAGCSVTPDPLSQQTITDTSSTDRKRIDSEQEPVIGAISLPEAIARALRNNREKKMQDLQAALAQGQLALVSKEMLPQLTAEAGYSHRNNYAASASVSFRDGEPRPISETPNYSVSQPKERTVDSVEFSWNILDFGLSYVRAKQGADRYLIAKEKLRTVTHNITEQVRAEYWRAVSAQRLLPEITPLMKQAEKALTDSHYVETLQISSPIQALYYQRELLDVLRSLQSVRQSLADSKIRLANLMGLKPGTEFDLADANNSQVSLPSLKLSNEQMEEYALQHRPDLLSTYYEKRISAAETRSALLKLFPSLKLSAGYFQDSNNYLLHQDWNNISTQVSWNLMNVFRISDERAVGKTRELYADEQRLATSVAVMAQVKMASLSYQQTLQSYQLADRYLDVAQRIKLQEGNRMKAAQSSKLDFIRESLNALLAELRRDVAYADLQNSYGRLFTSMGVDLVSDDYHNASLVSLTAQIQAAYDQWQQTGQPVTPSLMDTQPAKDTALESTEEQ